MTTVIGVAADQASVPRLDRRITQHQLAAHSAIAPRRGRLGLHPSYEVIRGLGRTWTEMVMEAVANPTGDAE